MRGSLPEVEHAFQFAGGVVVYGLLACATCGVLMMGMSMFVPLLADLVALCLGPGETADSAYRALSVASKYANSGFDIFAGSVIPLYGLGILFVGTSVLLALVVYWIRDALCKKKRRVIAPRGLGRRAQR